MKQVSFQPKVPSLALVLSLASLAAAWWFLLPGRMSPDSIAQLTQARSGMFSDDHPPIMALLWRLLDAAFPGPALLVALHLAVFALVCHLLARSIDSNVYVRMGMFLGMFFFLPLFPLLGIAWKDISFFVALTLTMVLTYREFRRVAEGGTAMVKPDKNTLVLAAVLLWYAIGVRYNGIFAAFPIAALGVWLVLPQWRVLRKLISAAVAGAMLCVAMFGSHSLIGRMVGATPTNFWQVLAVYDITAVSLATGEDRLDDRLFPGSSIEEMRKYFKPYSVLELTQKAPFYRTLTKPEDLAQLRSSWFGVMVSHPSVYLGHRWRMLTECLGATELHPWVPVFPTGSEAPQFETAWRASPDGVSVHVLTNLDFVASSTFVYRPWIHTVFTLVVLGFLYMVRSDRRGFLMFVTSVALANDVSLFLLAHSPDFRFSIPMLFASACALVLGIREAARMVVHEVRVRNLVKAAE